MAREAVSWLRQSGPELVALVGELFTAQAGRAFESRIWVWRKIEEPELRRFWSLVPVNQGAMCWVPSFDPQPYT